jgi:hypothetical protein
MVTKLVLVVEEYGDVSGKEKVKSRKIKDELKCKINFKKVGLIDA